MQIRLGRDFANKKRGYGDSHRDQLDGAAAADDVDRGNVDVVDDDNYDD